MSNMQRIRVVVPVLLITVGAVCAGEPQPPREVPKPAKKASAKLKAFVRLVEGFERSYVTLDDKDTPPSPKHSDLLKAVRGGDDAALEVALLEGGSPNDRSTGGVPAVLVAVEVRNLSGLRMLIEAGARVDTRAYQDDRTALTVAAERGEAVFVRELIEAGADPDRTGSGTETAIIKAARNGHVAAVQALVDGGADVNETDLTGLTVLEIAESNHHYQIAEILRNAGAYY